MSIQFSHSVASGSLWPHGLQHVRLPCPPTQDMKTILLFWKMACISQFNHWFFTIIFGSYISFFLAFFFIVVVFAIHWHESAMDLHVFPIPIPASTCLSTRFLWVFPVHQAQALVSCIQPGLVICFTLDNIHVSMLFSRNIPPSPSPTESKILFYICVSFSVLHIGLSLPSF